jgi:hypothetical protein
VSIAFLAMVHGVSVNQNTVDSIMVKRFRRIDQGVEVYSITSEPLDTPRVVEDEVAL